MEREEKFLVVGEHGHSYGCGSFWLAADDAQPFHPLLLFWRT